jgi:hypothetical protein
MSSLDPPPTLIKKKRGVKILISDSYAKQNENDGSKGLRAELRQISEGR